MATAASLYLKKETIDILAKTLEKKGMSGIEIIINLNDEANQFNQNVSAFVSQTEEDKKAEKKRFYVGNGRVFWTDGKVVVVKKETAKTASKPEAETNDDLPF